MKSVLNERGYQVECVEGKNTEGKCFAYILIASKMYRSFKHACENEELHLERYGIVLFRGQGNASPEKEIMALERLQQLLG